MPTTNTDVKGIKTKLKKEKQALKEARRVEFQKKWKKFIKKINESILTTIFAVIGLITTMSVLALGIVYAIGYIPNIIEQIMGK